MELEQLFSTPRKLYTKTYGCQMNIYDSERMQDILSSIGFSGSDKLEESDMVLLNTCHIREKAAEKMYSELGRINEIKQEREESGKEMIVAVAGCVAQAEGELIIKRAPYVDIVVGPQSYQSLPDLVGQVLRGKKGIVKLNFDQEEKFKSLNETTQEHSKGFASFLTIQEGCDKFCTFCVVPYTRGAEYSRKFQDVLDEAKRLVDKGTKEITLLGQNVNAYHGLDVDGKEMSLGKIIKALGKINGLERIRYTTSHPRDVDNDLIEAHATEKKLMPYLHLPVQAGSDRILEKMNRKHSKEFYLKTIEKFKNAQSNLIFSSDFIVGFPGETEEDFQQTLEVIKAVNYQAQCFSFKYSPRPGTPASLSDQIDEEVKSERLQRLQDLLVSQQKAFYDSMLGKKISVLFDRFDMREPEQIGGRSEYLQIAIYNSKNDEEKKSLYGTVRSAIVTKVNNNSLECKII